MRAQVCLSAVSALPTLHGFDKSVGKLGVDRIDLLILHQALPARFDLTQEAYRTLETLLADGRVRAIGVSNFMPAELTALDALDTGVRGGPEPDDVTLEAYGRSIPEA